MRHCQNASFYFDIVPDSSRFYLFNSGGQGLGLVLRFYVRIRVKVSRVLGLG